MFVGFAGDSPVGFVACALFLQSASFAAAGRIIPQLTSQFIGAESIGQFSVGRADIHILVRVVAELALAIHSYRCVGAGVGLGNERRDPVVQATADFSGVVIPAVGHHF